ncbi:MAG: hypothetical protein LC798_19155 [Chloroflexi bacterium]|nr:hypothetical protein [Chloroflexota bacterium]
MSARPTPDPRLARVIAGLDRIGRDLDALHADVVEVLRDHDVTLDDIGECYEPPKSRQAVAKWLQTRRRRREG